MIWGRFILSRRPMTKAMRCNARVACCRDGPAPRKIPSQSPIAQQKPCHHNTLALGRLENSDASTLDDDSWCRHSDPCSVQRRPSRPPWACWSPRGCWSCWSARCSGRKGSERRQGRQRRQRRQGRQGRPRRARERRPSSSCKEALNAGFRARIAALVAALTLAGCFEGPPGPPARRAPRRTRALWPERRQGRPRRAGKTQRLSARKNRTSCKEKPAGASRWVLISWAIKSCGRRSVRLVRRHRPAHAQQPLEHFAILLR